MFIWEAIAGRRGSAKCVQTSPQGLLYVIDEVNIRYLLRKCEKTGDGIKKFGDKEGCSEEKGSRF